MVNYPCKTYQNFCWPPGPCFKNDLGLNIHQVMTLDSYNTVDRCSRICIFELMYSKYSINWKQNTVSTSYAPVICSSSTMAASPE